MFIYEYKKQEKRIPEAKKRKQDSNKTAAGLKQNYRGTQTKLPQD